MTGNFVCDEWFVKDGKAWFLSACGNELFEVDIQRKAIHYLSKIPEQGVSFRAYNRCLKYGNTIYCFPDKGKNIWKYSIDNDEWNCIFLDIFEAVRAEVSICSYDDNKVYLFSDGIKSILVFDLFTERICYSFSVGIDSKVELGRKISVDGKLYVADYNNPYIYCVDYFNEKTVKHSIPVLEKGILAFTVSENDFWLSSFDKEIYKWTIGKDSIDSYSFPNGFKIFNPKFPPVFEIIEQSGILVFLPYNANMICYLQKEDSELSEMRFDGDNNDLIVRNQSKTVMPVYTDSNHTIYFNTETDIGFYSIDTKRKMFEKFELCYEEADLHVFLNSCREESTIVSVRDFINSVLKK